MTLAEIATLSGKGGLFKVMAPTKSGVILESLDDAKSKVVASGNNKISLLNEISIYTTTREGTVPRIASSFRLLRFVRESRDRICLREAQLREIYRGAEGRP